MPSRAGEEFFILDKSWTLPRYDRAPECGATGVTGTATTFMQIASVIVNAPRGKSFPLPISFQRRFDRVEEDPLPPSVTKVALWRIRLRDFEFRCKLRPNRSSIAVRRTMIIWIAFDEISHDSGNGWLESGTAVRFCTSSHPSAPNVHRLFATMHNLGFDGKHGRVCYVIVFFHF